MGGMEELVRDGKLLHVGVSNFSLRRIEEARSALPKSELSSVQLDYSLIHRDVEKEILPHCEREKIALLAYFPLGHGALPNDKRLDELSSKYSKTRAQVALQWLAGLPNVFPIPRASNYEHVAENVGASDWTMSPEDRTSLGEKFR